MDLIVQKKRHKRIFFRHIFVLLAWIGVSCLSGAMAQSASATLAASEQAVSAAKMDFLVAAAVQAGQKDTADLRSQVREALVQHEVLLAAAQKAPVAKQANVQAQAQYSAETTLVRAYLQQWLQQNPIAVEAVQTAYDALKEQMGSQEVQIRHILLPTLDEALKVQAQITAGEKFEELASSVSQDPASKSSGGLMPWVVRGALLHDIAQAVGKLNKGQMTDTPVKGSAGFHIIRLEDTRPFKAPELAQVQDQIKKNLEARAVSAHIQKLREQAAVK